jgi:hypothetical protein
MEEYQIEMLFERMLSQLSLSVELETNSDDGWGHNSLKVSVKLRNQHGRQILAASESITLP